MPYKKNYFKVPANEAEVILSFHDDLMFFLVFICIFIFILLFFCISKRKSIWKFLQIFYEILKEKRV